MKREALGTAPRNTVRKSRGSGRSSAPISRRSAGHQPAAGDRPASCVGGTACRPFRRLWPIMVTPWHRIGLSVERFRLRGTVALDGAMSNNIVLGNPKLDEGLSGVESEKAPPPERICCAKHSQEHGKSVGSDCAHGLRGSLGRIYQSIVLPDFAKRRGLLELRHRLSQSLCQRS
jgi:hypothetical protein